MTTEQIEQTVLEKFRALDADAQGSSGSNRGGPEAAA